MKESSYDITFINSICHSVWHGIYLFLFCRLEKYIHVNVCMFATLIIFFCFAFCSKLKLSLYTKVDLECCLHIWVGLTYGQVTLELAVDFGGLGSPRLHLLLPLKDPLPDDFPVLHRVGLTRLCRHVHIGLLIHCGLGEHGLVDGIGGHC